MEGDKPRLIDEWQIAPSLWDSIRFYIDHGPGKGQFLLTGSSVPANYSKMTHSGTGRFTRIKMRPMSLFESGESNGEIKLKYLFGNKDIQISALNNLEIQDITYLVCRGG